MKMARLRSKSKTFAVSSNERHRSWSKFDIGKIRRAISITQNENASSSIEIDSISAAFNRTKERSNSMAHDRSSTTNHDGQDRRGRIDRNEIDESDAKKKNRKSNHSNGPILATESGVWRMKMARLRSKSNIFAVSSNERILESDGRDR